MGCCGNTARQRAQPGSTSRAPAAGGTTTGVWVVEFADGTTQQFPTEWKANGACATRGCVRKYRT